MISICLLIRVDGGSSRLHVVPLDVRLRVHQGLIRLQVNDGGVLLPSEPLTSPRRRVPSAELLNPLDLSPRAHKGSNQKNFLVSRTLFPPASPDS